MLLRIEFTDQDLKRLILRELQNKLKDIKVDNTLLQIQVKSVQNFKAEWERAAFRAIYVYNS